MRFDIDAIVTHVAEHFPSDRLTAAQASAGNPLGVEEQRYGIPQLFQDRPRDFVLGFPAVIERDYGAARRNILLSALPCEQILQADYRDAAVFQQFHLLLKHRRRDLRSRITDLVDET